MRLRPGLGSGALAGAVILASALGGGAAVTGWLPAADLAVDAP
ncbi:hypothetical protein [Methylorubrum podarium]|nr:hypothetical protein [Methylorubrum podarium]GJE73277.1 hypothetical protein CHKEEEPN_4841 [Methylorubrum podarium]